MITSKLIVVNKKAFQNGYFAIKECRHGYFAFNTNDNFVGRSLDFYGEWTEPEIQVLTPLLTPGDIVVDVGAYIGTHTIPFAKAVGPGGAVFAIEAQRTAVDFLHTNVALNNLMNVSVVNKYASDKVGKIKSMVLDQRIEHNFGSLNIKNVKNGDTIETTKIDNLPFPKNRKVRLIKVDVEGVEENVLRGASKIIENNKPILYIECSTTDDAKRKKLLKTIFDMNYVPYWHYFLYYSEKNFFANKENIFEGVHPEVNVICFPKGLRVIQSIFLKVRDENDYWLDAHKREVRRRKRK